MTNIPDRIIDRIQKLLRMAESNSPNEAAIAATKADELLLQYNLERAAVEARGEIDRDPYVKHYIDAGGTKPQYGWRGNLLAAIARSGFCKDLYQARILRFCVIGKQHNVEAVEYLYTYLAGEVDRLARAAWKAEGKYATSIDRWGYRGPANYGTWTKVFALAAADAIAGRLYMQRREQQAAQTAAGDATRALVVMSDAELKQAVTQLFPNMRGTYRGDQSQALDRYVGAHIAGYAAGQSVSINQGIGTSSRGAVALLG